MDNLKPEHRRKNMQNIRSKDTNIELKVRSALHRKGYRFRKNATNLIGKPDLVFPKYNLIVFLDSCFWHACPFHGYIPGSNTEYWIPKLHRNKLRAKEVNAILKKDGWKILRIWEHEINNDFDKALGKIIKNMG